MERKDRVTDWAIGIFFVALVAYVELLREQMPSIWRVCLVVGLLCFIMRLFISSCLAYGYLEKWRYLLDIIEKHRMSNTMTLDFVKNEIEKYHYTPRTTKKRMYFVKSQLLAGFVLLFFFSSFLLLLDLYSNPQEMYAIIPISFLVVYYVYESFMFIEYEPLNMPYHNSTKNANHTEEEAGT